jgi:NitT/TauT family transport system substrate-binding protein
MLKTLVLGPNGPTYDLPGLVAQELGFFAEEGLDVQYVEKKTDEFQALALADRQKERLFDQGQVQVFNACEWGCLRRVERAEHPGWMIAKRPLLQTQCLAVGPDLNVTCPEDLAGRRIGVSWETGGHYMTLKMLEGFVPRDEINVVHAGFHDQRLAALLDGSLEAAVLPEPFVSVAEKAGFKVMAEAVFRGGEVVNDELDADTVRGLMRGLRRAVAAINADLPKYRRRILEQEHPGPISYDEVRWDRIAFVNPSRTPGPSSTAPATGCAPGA